MYIVSLQITITMHLIYLRSRQGSSILAEQHTLHISIQLEEFPQWTSFCPILVVYHNYKCMYVTLCSKLS